MNEEMFKRETFLFEDSNPMTVCVAYEYEYEGEPVRHTEEVSPELLQNRNGGLPIHVDMMWGYEIGIYAVSNNNVYLVLYDRVDENGWKRVEEITLNKFHPQRAVFVHSRDGKEAVVCVYIKELGGLRRAIML